MRGAAGRIGAWGAGIVAASVALSPAISAVRTALEPVSQSQVSLKALGSIGSFTPVTNDERLARAYAQAANSARSQRFKFTPTSGATSGERSITILVRAPEWASKTQPAALPNLGVSPVSYNLGVTRGLQRFTAPENLGSHELEPIVADLALPEARSFSLDKGKKRFSTNVELAANTPTGAAPQTLVGQKSIAVDVASSYSLTRNLDVRAGVRYGGVNNRLDRLTDDAQDSQAVYVGTAFKF